MTLVTADTIEKWSDLKAANDERGISVYPYRGEWAVRLRSNDGTETKERTSTNSQTSSLTYSGSRLYRKFKTKKAAEIFAANLRKHLYNETP